LSSSAIIEYAISPPPQPHIAPATDLLGWQLVQYRPQPLELIHLTTSIVQCMSKTPAKPVSPIGHAPSESDGLWLVLLRIGMLCTTPHCHAERDLKHFRCSNVLGFQRIFFQSLVRPCRLFQLWFEPTTMVMYSHTLLSPLGLFTLLRPGHVDEYVPLARRSSHVAARVAEQHFNL
jgi:hypothetical protein